MRTGAEASLLLDAEGCLVAVSGAAAALLQLDHDSIGRPLVDVVELVDFTAAAATLSSSAPLPMLTAMQTGRLTRAVIRVRTADRRCTTYDVISAPLIENGGSLSFLLPV